MSSDAKPIRLRYILCAAFVLVISGCAGRTPLAVNIWAPDGEKNVGGLRLNLPYGVDKNVTGIDLGLLGGEVEGKMIGIQAGLLGAVSYDMIGIQIGGFATETGIDMTGVQIGGISAIANDNMTGIQAGALGAGTGNNMTGMQIGGLATVTARHMTGVQIALINRAGSLNGGFQIGLVNIAPDGFLPVSPLINYGRKKKAKFIESLAEAIGDSLVNAEGKEIPISILDGKDYVLLYFSAQWCPPCRDFTPNLVDFYDKYSEKGNLEVILVSSDRSEEAMFKYMRDYNMQFYAAPYARGRDSGLAAEFDVRGIPRLIVLDGKGEAVMDCRWIGRHRILDDLAKRLK